MPCWRQKSISGLTSLSSSAPAIWCGQLRADARDRPQFAAARPARPRPCRNGRNSALRVRGPMPAISDQPQRIGRGESLRCQSPCDAVREVKLPGNKPRRRSIAANGALPFCIYFPLPLFQCREHIIRIDVTDQFHVAQAVGRTKRSRPCFTFLSCIMASKFCRDRVSGRRTGRPNVPAALPRR